jgi:hypothetical protein
MARDSDLTSLFNYHRPTRRGMSPYALSALIHGCGGAVVFYAMLHAPVVVEGMTERYSVRHLDLRYPEQDPPSKYAGTYPRSDVPKERQEERNAKPGETAPAGPDLSAKPEPQPSPLPAMQVATGGSKGKQTLLQPEFRTHPAMPEEMPVPTIMIWTPELAAEQKIVPPKPDKPTTVPVTASVEEPNEEIEMANMGVTAAEIAPKAPAPPAGTSSPVVVKGPELAQMPPATASSSDEQPTPTAMLSVSDLRMDQGTLALPPANETRKSDKPGDAPPPAAAAQSSRVLTAGDGNGGGGGGGAPGAVASAADDTEHIQLPKDGKFSVVVVGASTTDQYPEALQIWSDRVAYTVYLHVGLQKAWILQYSEVKSATLAAGGAVSRLEAPWPYDIFRPNLVTRDLNADALMVHGILNEAGKLVSLAVAFPSDYARGSFVLAALRRWQFRPARSQGKATSVEVLLIIPEEVD